MTDGDISPAGNAEPKKHGLAHVFAATGYSWGGFRRALRETAFRHELLFLFGSSILFALAGATSTDYVLLIILFMLVFAFEAVNTAIEEMVDRISPEISDMARHAKDLGSFAVFCSLVSAGLFVAWVVLF